VLFASRPGASLTVAACSLVVVVEDMDDNADEEEIVISRLMLLVMDRNVNASIDRPMIHRIMVIINMVLLVLLRLLLLLLLLVVVVVVVVVAAALIAFSKKFQTIELLRGTQKALSLCRTVAVTERGKDPKKRTCAACCSGIYRGERRGREHFSKSSSA
jgi:hypothetical protein